MTTPEAKKPYTEGEASGDTNPVCYAYRVGFHPFNWRFGSEHRLWSSDDYWISTSYGPITIIRIYEK